MEIKIDAIVKITGYPDSVWYQDAYCKVIEGRSSRNGLRRWRVRTLHPLKGVNQNYPLNINENHMRVVAE